VATKFIQLKKDKIKMAVGYTTTAAGNELWEHDLEFCLARQALTRNFASIGHQ
jgi:hypothetical protein